MTAPDGGLDDDQRHLAALAALGASPGKLRAFVATMSPVEAWEALADGCHPADPDGHYRRRATDRLLAQVHAACLRSAVAVRGLGTPAYPECLAGDRQAPAALFTWGRPELLEGRPRVAVVGTRAASRSGREVAAAIGRGLAEAGCVVVSGLAAGIDTAAHQGALEVAREGTVVGVLGTALDAPGPAASMHLRRAVAARGSLLSELPAGAVGAPWWFAVRNRLMAALAHVVVVVESHLGGGSMHTVRAARARRVPVAAVPGPLTSPSCAGTNLLLVQGAQAVRDADDVVDLALRAVRGRPGIAEPAHRGGSLVPNGTRRTGTPGVDLPASEVARRVWPVLDERFASLEAVVARSGVAPADAALGLEQLRAAGLAVEESGWWRRR